MYVARIELVFDAAHRLLGYDGKCASAHGHTFRAEVTVGARALDELGLTLDFRDLKAQLKEWVDTHWDHGFLLNDRDVQLAAALRAVPENKLYLFPGMNPSVEVIAKALFDEARRRFGPLVQRVRVWETPAQYAEFYPDDAGEQPRPDDLARAEGWPPAGTPANGTARRAEPSPR